MCLNNVVASNHELSDEELKRVLEIDSLVYPESYQSTYEQVLLRFNCNRGCFTTLLNEGKIVGYICYFPITQRLREGIVNGTYTNDVDLASEDVLAYEASQGSLYIISLAIDPKYQGTDALKVMMSAFEHRLNTLALTYGIEEVLAVTVSEKGRTTLEKQGFNLMRDIDEQVAVFGRKL